jgi:hypothetical protein
MSHIERIYNVTTNEIIEIPYTAEQEAEVMAAQAEATAAAAKAATNAAVTAAAVSHAKSLGFTDEMIAVMYPNLGVQP